MTHVSNDTLLESYIGKWCEMNFIMKYIFKGVVVWVHFELFQQKNKCIITKDVYIYIYIYILLIAFVLVLTLDELQWQTGLSINAGCNWQIHVSKGNWHRSSGSGTKVDISKDTLLK